MHARVRLAVVMRGAEVDDLNRSAVVNINQNVLWLQITMCNIAAVAVGDCLQNLLSHNTRFVFSEYASRRDLLEQLAAVAQLSDEEDVALILVDLVEPNDVGMVEVLQDVDLKL